MISCLSPFAGSDLWTAVQQIDGERFASPQAIDVPNLMAFRSCGPLRSRPFVFIIMGAFVGFAGDGPGESWGLLG